MVAVLLLLAGLVVVSIGELALMRWAMHWGAEAPELRMPMPGDDWLAGGPRARVQMSRAISITEPPEVVWPWLAQLGRGAGWYSIDRLDNGGRPSARHLVSWIPEPRLGDASAVGYLRHLLPGQEMAWWMPGERFLAAITRMVFSIRLRPEGRGSRLIIRVSGDAAGPTAWLVMLLFPLIDSIMARRQLLGIRDRVEQACRPASDPAAAETGDRDQYQLYEVVYASGEKAGMPGKEHAARWRQAALDAGAIAQIDPGRSG